MMTRNRKIIFNPAEGVPGASGIQTISAAVMLEFSPIVPVRVVRWGFIATAAISDNATGTLTLTGNLWPTTHSATSATVGSTTSNTGTGYNSSNAPTFYVDTAGGSLTVPNSLLNAGGGIAAGAVAWHNVNPQTSQTGGYYPAADTALIAPGGVDTQLLIYPGQSFVINCTAAPSTPGSAKFFVDVEEQAFVADFNNNAAVVSGYPSTNGTTPTPSWPFAHTVLNYQS